MIGVPYFEIQADQPARALKFYESVFGWSFQKVEGLPIDYWQMNGDLTAGLLARPAPAPAPRSGTNAFVCSFEVKDFDATAESIIHNGGHLAMPKFPVAGRCWQGYFIDPEGNTFGIFEVDKSAR